MIKKMTMKEFEKLIKQFDQSVVSEETEPDRYDNPRYIENESLKDDVHYFLCLIYDMYDEFSRIDRYSVEDLGLVTWYLAYFNIEVEVQ